MIRELRNRSWLLPLMFACAASAACTQSFDDYRIGSGGSTGGSAPGGGGAGANGGGGGGPECTAANAATVCDDNNVCTTDACSASGTCTNTDVPDGLAPGYTDMPTDCIEDRCVGGDPLLGAADDTEMPDDANECTNQSCSGGLVQTMNVMNGTACGMGLSCSDGVCDGCTTAEMCGTATECATFVCNAEGGCETNFVAAGIEVMPIVNGDCKENQCTGNSPTVIVVNVNDPNNDNNVCTTDTCVNGTPTPVNNTNNCGALTCMGATLNPADTCAGGTCGVTPPMTCGGGYNCNMMGNACRTMCTMDSACQGPAFVCNTNTSMCCDPDDTGTTCAAVDCGTVTNNCAKSVLCPDTCGSNGDGTACLPGNQCGCTVAADCTGSTQGHACITTPNPDRCGCSSDTNCDLNRFCDIPNTVCLPDLANGATCARDAQCAAASFCNSTGNVCAADLMTGATCARNEQCASNVCLGTNLCM